MNRNRSSVVWGTILVVLGVLLLVGRSFGLLAEWELWPLIILGLGVAFFVAMVLSGTGGLAIPGSILVMIGIIALVQTNLGWWEIWTYGWALIVSAVGMGMVFLGGYRNDLLLRQRGWHTVRTGLLLFLVFGALFEFFFAAAGIATRGSALFWSLVLILAGLLQLIIRIIDVVGSPYQKGERGLFGPVFLIGIGIMAVLFSLGWLPVWRLVLLVNLWPLLLVALGVELLFGRSPWVGGLVGLLVVAAMLFAILQGEQMGIRPGLSWLGEDTLPQSWQVNELIYGSGKLGEETRPVSGFDQVTLSGVGTLRVVQGQTEGLVITAEENLLPQITTEVNDGKLVIGSRNGVALLPTQKLEYRLTVKDLKTVSVTGWNEVILDPLKVKQLDLSIAGTGKFELKDLQATMLQVEINGFGSVSASGKVDELQVTINGAGGFKGSELSSQVARVKIAGFGNAVVWAQGSLEATVEGMGDVAYSGSPEVLHYISGIGLVHRLGGR